MATQSSGKPEPEADAPSQVENIRSIGVFHDSTISMKRLQSKEKEKEMAETAVGCSLVVNSKQIINHATYLIDLKRLIDHADLMDLERFIDHANLISNSDFVYIWELNESLRRMLEILGTVLTKMMDKCFHLNNVENLATNIEVVASKVADISPLVRFDLPAKEAVQIYHKIQAIKVEMVDFYEMMCDILILQAAGNPSYCWPSTSNGDILDMVEIAETEAHSHMENLTQLINCAALFIQGENVRIGSLRIGLRILMTIVAVMEKKCYEHENAETLVGQIRGVASKAVFMETTFKTGADMVEDIMVEVMDIYDNICDIRVLQAGKPSDGCPSRASNTIGSDETVVGFEDEAMTVKDQLTRGRTEQLEVVSIIGMPGLGKTTLARKVYNDPYITYHFHIRAWTYVSQVYKKRECLLEILHSLVDLDDKIEEMSNERLAERLYKSLKGKRYLIVMDDIWSIEAWNDIRVYLPNDNTGSKVLFTSRLKELVLCANGVPHFLRSLNEEESWELFHRKVFQKHKFAPNLMEIGMQITRNCKGLPLAIVVIAGLLGKTERTRDWWIHVAGSVSSYVLNDPNQFTNILTLSYDHLPRHLKPCFLYLGAFRDDREIPVWKLILLWIAEGFIQQTGERRLEDIAEDYLMDLIDRSLVLVARKRSNGRIKTCRVHDLLHDLCLKKAEEFNFLEQRREYEQAAASSSSHRANTSHRLCIHSDFLNFGGISETEPYAPVIQSSHSSVLNFEPSAPIVRSLLCFGNLDRTPLNFTPTFVEPYASVFNHFSIQHESNASAFSFLLAQHESNKSMRYFLDVFRYREDIKECEDLLFQKECHLFVEGYSFLKCRHPSLWWSLFEGYNHLRPYSTDQSNSGPFFVNRAVKLLRVLDLWCNIFFSAGILLLTHLRYLAVQTDDFYVLPESICKLLNLETLILGTRSSHIIVPRTIRKMVKLRHLYSKGGVFHIDFFVGHSFVLRTLQTISYLCPCRPFNNFLARTPNLRKLGFRGNLISSSNQLKPPHLPLNPSETSVHLQFPNVTFLSHLETLKLDNRAPVESSDLKQVTFPKNLKSLTLRGTRIKWKEIQIIGMLSKLEVLKLEEQACRGPEWKTTDGGFQQLKFLKFKHLDIQRWITSSTHFPSLQHFVLENCVLFEEIPAGLGDILTLQVIEVKFCSPFVDLSARKIKGEQECNGNNLLKVLIDNQECSGITYETEESSGSGQEEE